MRLSRVEHGDVLYMQVYSRYAEAAKTSNISHGNPGSGHNDKRY